MRLSRIMRQVAAVFLLAFACTSVARTADRADASFASSDEVSLQGISGAAYQFDRCIDRRKNREADFGQLKLAGG